MHGRRQNPYRYNVFFGFPPSAFRLIPENVMSDKQSTTSSHSKTFFLLSIVLGVVLSTGLYYVGAPSGTAVSPVHDLAQAQRIQKVGMVQLKVEDKNRPLSNGEGVYKAQCAACHGAGMAGAPIFGNAAAWGPRLGQGFDALVNSALKGKGAMGAQGGGQFSDLEIARGVAYMANAAGGKFEEPAAPAASE